MSESETYRPPGIGRRALAWLGQLALVALAYVLFAGLIYLGNLLGDWTGIGWLRFSGLVADIVLLSVVYGRLAASGNALANSLGPVLALLAVFLLFAVAEPFFDRHNRLEGTQLVTLADYQSTFWTLERVQNIGVHTSVVAVAALGMTLIIISGGIDLSAGTALALCAVVLAWCLKMGVNFYLAVGAGLLVGAFAGAVNGTLITLLRVVPFIVTLGMMKVQLGVSKLVADNTNVYPPLGSVPDWVPRMVRPTPAQTWISWPLLPNFSACVWLALALAAVLAVVLHLTVFGRHVFAVGSSEPTARLCGINVPRVKILIYTIAGLFVGMAGFYQFATLESAMPTAGIGMELEIIAAVVIGGGSLRGGRGSVVGTLTGAAITSVIASGCSVLELGNPVQDIVVGAIIIVAVSVDQWRARRSES